MAVGVKVAALAAWPMLLRLAPGALVAAILTLTRLYGFFAIQGFDWTRLRLLPRNGISIR